MRGSFLAVSKPILQLLVYILLAAFFRDLQDLHTFTPLETEHPSKKKGVKKESNFFAILLHVVDVLQKVMFRQSSTNSAQILIKFYRNYIQHSCFTSNEWIHKQANKQMNASDCESRRMSPHFRDPHNHEPESLEFYRLLHRWFSGLGDPNCRT